MLAHVGIALCWRNLKIAIRVASFQSSKEIWCYCAVSATVEVKQRINVLIICEEWLKVLFKRSERVLFI